MVTLPQISVEPVNHCTLACVGCQHYSPQRERAIHSPEDFVRSLEKLNRYAQWPYLFVSGGEPFLHPDLGRWITEVNRGEWKRPCHLITNGFWLLRDDYDSFSAPVLSTIHTLIVSRYPIYVNRLGVEEWDRRLATLRQTYAVKIRSFHDDPNNLEFGQHWFHSEPHPTKPVCAMRSCLSLLPDGRLAKCPLGLALDKIPNATEEFIREYEQSAYYCLNLLPNGLDEFVRQEVHPACSYCGLATGHMKMLPWRHDPKIRTAQGSEYLQLIGLEL